jgi:cytochrome c peroxidase
MRCIWNQPSLGLALTFALLSARPVAASGGTLQLDFVSAWADQDLPRAAWPAALARPELRLERLDFLVSGLALRRADGSWLESADWYGLVRQTQSSVLPPATGLPAETFTGIRFDIGLPAAINAADPAPWPVGHALHPDTSGLHWGWQGGYVFLALEGKWKTSSPKPTGFSFHLATDTNRTRVELPVTLTGGGPLTLRLSLDVATLLEGIDFERDGTSTHSRAGDPLAARLAANAKRAFRVRSVHPDLFQAAADSDTATAPAESAPPPPGTRPLTLDITRRFPQVALPKDNPLTHEGVALGETLFHDPRLSVNNTQSCASCHDRSAAFSDTRRVSLGAEGQVGKRQSMPLFNLAWSHAFFWDGRAATLRQQVLMPIQDTHEMNETLDRAIGKIGDLKPAFTQAFGTPEITSDRLAKALEQYLLTLISQDSRFDRAARKVTTLTEEEKRGLQLFVTEHDPKRGLFGADCFHCHGGTLFTDHSFKNNGLDLTPEDLGLMTVTGKDSDRGKFKKPSLRNIATTAPYMHDGRFATLEEVVAHYNGPLTRSSDTLDANLAKHPDSGIQLSAEDQRALVAFLKTLTDEAFVAPGHTSSLANQP